VSIILDGRIRVLCLPDEARAAIVDAGRQAKRTRYGTEVAFDGIEPDLMNDDLIALLQMLARNGVGFARDYKQGWSPSEVVGELIERGVHFENPWACGFDGHAWHVQPYPWSHI